MESQACVSNLQGAGAQFTDQAAQTAGAREARSLDGTARNQPSLVDGFHARPDDKDNAGICRPCPALNRTDSIKQS